MLSLVLNEHQVHLFNFYLNGEVRSGMRWGGTLYGLAHSVQTDLRLEAYRFANDLAETGCSVVITVAERYKVWVRLNATDYPYWNEMNRETTAVSA